MTTVSPAPGAQAPAPIQAHRSGFAGVMLGEWTKIRSVRSTVWTLIIFVVVSLGLTGLFTWLTLIQLNNGSGDARSSGIVSDPVNFILGTGLGLGQLAICVLGVLVITSEYSSGAIRSSLLAVPRRYPVMLAKGLVFAALVIVVGEVVAFASFFIGKALVNGHVVTGHPTIGGYVVAVFCAWTVLLLAAAVYMLQRRDA